MRFVRLDCFNGPTRILKSYVRKTKWTGIVVSIYGFCEYIAKLIAANIGLA